MYTRIPGEATGVTTPVDNNERTPVPDTRRCVARLRLYAVLLGVPESDSLQALDEQRSEHQWLVACCEELHDTPFERWQAEHTRLFVTGFPNTVCPPFESAMRGQGMSGSAMEELEGFYRGLGLSARGMPPDYLGTMLECWAYLTERSDEDAAATLWERHLASWLPGFAGTLRRSAELMLYRRFGEQLERLCAAHGPDCATDPAWSTSDAQ